MSSDPDQKPWWKGTHGEWYVVVQLGLIALLLFGPRTLPGWPAWTFPFAGPGSFVGAIFLLIGALFLFFGILKHGKNITPVPYPQDHATLIESGPYKLVRHPMYCGGIFVAFGWALWVHGWLTIIYAIVIFLFLDIKARREEEWLKERFSGYGPYQRRVRKLIPFVY
jgi:protein-S-isoprenylcysteine O-methyltransferase Ste14